MDDKSDRRNDDTPAAHTPTECPFCQSRSLASTDRKINAESYWRCERCGQIWNPARLHVPGNSGYIRGR
jgi:ribosomal protein L37AE/L43A